MMGNNTVNDGGTITTKWYVSKNSDLSDSKEVETETASLCIPATNEAGVYYYYYKAVNTLQNFTAEAISPVAKITVVDTLPDLNGLTKDGKNIYLINSVEDLNIIGGLVKEGNPLFGYTFKITKDLTLPVDFEPIGVLKEGQTDPAAGANINPFSGNIDGQNHKLTVSKGGKSLLGYVRQASVKNLNIFGESINGYGLVDNYTVDYAGGS